MIDEEGNETRTCYEAFLLEENQRIMNIEKGWRLQCADFSVQASGRDSAKGSVTLVRSPEERARWHKMPENLQDDKDGPPLYVVGYGMTIKEAIVNANIKAAQAIKISA